MAKKKPQITLRSYGIYSTWESKSKDLPKIMEFTTEVPAEIDIEFGLTINVKSARGQKIFYCIDHPGIYDTNGNIRAPFTGEVHITNNDWDFYLGDTVWSPIHDKCGCWKMSITLNGDVVANKSFNVGVSDERSTKQRFSAFK